jgi:hypothetical protein
MKLNHITLHNFRCFQHAHLELHPQLTVLVANNGQGKTTFLDAISIALWPYINEFDLANSAGSSKRNSIAVSDVYLSRKTIEELQNSEVFNNKFGIASINLMFRKLPCEIQAKANIQDKTMSWVRFRDKETPNSHTKDNKECKDLRQLGKNTQKQLREMQILITLPVFAYYGTGRLWNRTRLTAGSKSETYPQDSNISTFAYRDCLNPASNYRQFENWFVKTYYDIINIRISAEMAEKYMNNEELYALFQPLRVIQEAVKIVLSTVGWDNPQYSGTKETITLSHKKYGILAVNQLSDGIQAVFALVADLAYRCYLLNSHLGDEATKQTPGIVLIDEVDMHLHPKWQQTILTQLRTAFPGIQFIVTTHSPQVLSTVAAENIRIIHENGEIETPTEQSEGIASNEILARILGVNPTPDIDIARKLSEYRALIEDGDYESAAAEQLKKQIQQHFGEQHFIWRDCERLIRLQESKRRLAAKKENRRA